MYSVATEAGIYAVFHAFVAPEKTRVACFTQLSKLLIRQVDTRIKLLNVYMSGARAAKKLHYRHALHAQASHQPLRNRE